MAGAQVAGRMNRRPAMRRMLLAALLVASGCDLFKSPDRFYTYCDATGCYRCDESGCSPAGAPTGASCQTSADCAQGCYCTSNGQCAEAGFCNQNSDCGSG